MTRTVGITALLLATAAAHGQGAGRVPQSPRSDKTGTPPRAARDVPAGKVPARASSFGIYGQETSRELFAACDLDGDDHITLIEAMRTLKSFDRSKFRAWDADSDGRIQFSEFDTQFKKRTRYGGHLTVSELALRRLPKAGSRVDPILLNWFSSMDKDGNDQLDLDEWKVLGALLETDSRAMFIKLDKNLSNSLTVRELLPMLPRISTLDKTRQKAKSTKAQPRPLPAEYRVADLDSNGLLSLRELERALQRIHPSMVRHARRVLAGADSNRDGYLDVFEVQKLAAPSRK